MGNIQVKDVPEELHRRLRRVAREQGTTIREVVLEGIALRLARDRFRKRLARRKRVDIGPASQWVEEGRAERDRELRR